MTVSELARYPDPTTSLPSKVRKDGERTRGKWNLDELHIEGNEGGKIPNNHLAWLPSYPADTPIEVLREAYERDGVVHVKGVLPRDQVLDIRRKFFEFVKPCGVLKDGTEPVQGIYSGGDPSQFLEPKLQEERRENDHTLLELATQAGYESFMLEFTNDPKLLEWVRRLLPHWKEPWRFRPHLMRTNIPHAYKTATRVHYDQMYLRGMKPGVITAWIPVGDIPPTSGGLMYLEDSVTVGVEIEDKFRELNKDLPIEEQMDAFNRNMLEGGGLTRDCAAFCVQTKRRWLLGDYEAGDVVFHQCLQIHCSANNEDPDERIRFATDVRYIDKQASFEERWDEYYL